MRKCLLVGLIFLLIGGRSYSSEFSSVEIYYYSWDIEFRHAKDQAFVRNEYLLKLEIRDPTHANLFYESLPIFGDVVTDTTSRIVDVRLVIDFMKEDGKTQTFYADRFFLYFDDGAKMVGIDKEFKERFEKAPR